VRCIRTGSQASVKTKAQRKADEFTSAAESD